jgi:hypothetical protein
MKAFLKVLGHAARYVTSSVLSFAVWTLWLALVVLLVAQVWILTSHQLSVPDFVLRSLEDQLAASQLHAGFGETQFDPSGRVLVRDVTLTSPSFAEPLATAETVYVRLDPWALLAGRFEARELRASGVSCFVPAMFSVTGKSEPLVRDLAITVVPGEQELEIRQLAAQVGTLVVTANGSIHLPKRTPGTAPSASIASFIAQNYPPLSRHLAAYLNRLNLLEAPRLHLDLTPSETRGAIVTATLSARGARLEQPMLIEARDLTLRTRLPALGETITKAQLDLAMGELRLPHAVAASSVHARVRGTLRPEERTFDADEAEITAAGVEGGGVRMSSFSARATRRGSPVEGAAFARIADAPLAIAGEADLEQGRATAHVEAAVTNALLAALGPLAKRDLTSLLEVREAPSISADLRFDSGWKFASADARLATRPIVARSVPLDAVRARITFSGTSFEASDIVLQQGGNVARGSFRMDTASHDYRFLLTGRLRPLEISGWFHEWWPNFFHQFDFSASPPRADVDVHGQWGDPHSTIVFIEVDADAPVVRTVPFDRVRTVLFIRPNFYDSRELLATRGGGYARGAFTREVDLKANAFTEMEFGVTTTLDVQESARLFGESGRRIVEPFRAAKPPLLRINGHLDGPASGKGAHETVHIEGQSSGAFSVYDFPLNDVSFVADVHDNDLQIHDIKAGFANGVTTGTVRIAGQGDERRIGFNLALKEGNLAHAIVTTENFFARREKTPPASETAFLEKAGDIRLDLTAAAEGFAKDVYSFHGDGNAELTGGELGQVRLLGLLSELLNFTALRFTTMHSAIKIDGARLVFPDVKLAGANSSIDAKGIYALDRKELDFTAKVFPFGESHFAPQALIGMVLSPLSQVLEVKLTGSLAKPKWAFVLGPTNFLRNLTGSQRPAAQEKPAAEDGSKVSPYLRR